MLNCTNQKIKSLATKDELKPNAIHQVRCYPQAIKYMGSKAKILNFIKDGIDELKCDKNLPIVDLFSGACSIAGGFGNRTKIISNDIQTYSEALASSYLKKIDRINEVNITELAEQFANKKTNLLPDGLSYPKKCSLKEFNQIEKRNQNLINLEIKTDYHLYTKYYSGTWWSAQQCVWIDSIKQTLDSLRSKSKISDPDYMIGMTALMHAMAYSSQGTGHYAQYRDAKTESSMKDINLYRQKDVRHLFDKKIKSLSNWNQENVIELGHEMHALDYKDCLNIVPKSIVYADPPYAFVHYSRFYHAIETLCKYDYPKIQEKGGKIVKGRYREDRHQSPFCIKTQVERAFSDLFNGTKLSNSHLLLSYSNAGMITLEKLVDLAKECFGIGYEIQIKNIDYQHKTMGRKSDHSREVKEALIIAKKK